MNKLFSLYTFNLLLLLIANSAKTQEAHVVASHEKVPDSVVVLEEVTVESYQFLSDFHQVPGSISVMKPKEINVSDGTNLMNSLNLVPGIHMQSGTYATNRIVIRGMGSRTPYNTNRIRTYLNDIPLTSADGVSSPEDIDIQSYGRLEVIKGPASAIYGSGLGGSINMFTPVKPDNEVAVSSGYGSFNTWNNHISGTFHHKNSSLWAGLGYLKSDGYRQNNQYKRVSFITTDRWKKKNWELQPMLMVINADAGIPSSLSKTQFESNPEQAAPGWLAAEGFKEYSKILGGITAVTQISNKAVNRFTVFGKWYDGYEKRPFNNLSDNSTSAGIRERATLYFDRMDLVLGTELISEQYKWEIEKDEELINKNRENRNLVNVFAISNLRPARHFHVSLAAAVNYLQYSLTDMYSNDGDQSGKRDFPLLFSPRIGINFAPADNLAVYASAGHGFSQPSPEETLLPEGTVNSDIRPEQGFQYEAGTRVNLWNNTLELDAAFYWIELNNLLVTKRMTEDIFVGINAGKSRHYGMEISIKNKIFDQAGFPGKLSSLLSLTTSRNRFVDFVDDGSTYNGNDLPGIPRQTVHMLITWNPLRELEVLSNVQYIGYQYLSDDNSSTYPGYMLADIKLSATLPLIKTGNLIFYTGINNLGDTRYASMLVVNAVGFGASEPRYYYPGLPRNFYFGLKFHFR